MINNPSGCTGRISLDLNDDKFWNKMEFIKFLNEYQGQVIDIEVPEGVALDSIGVYDLIDLFSFKAVTIRTFNVVQEPHPLYKLNIHPIAFRYFNVSPSTDYGVYHSWTGKYTFGAFYNRPTWNRIGLASYLHAQHRDKTILNFRYDPSDSEHRKVFELDNLFQIDPASIEHFGKMIPSLPMQVESQDSYTIGVTTQDHTDQLSEFYRDFLIDIVSETFVRGRCFYPTEKTVRPMLMKKPFIHMGPKCFLIHLRQMGFKTFGDFWDEDYDGHGMEQRYTRILALLDSIATKTPDELQRLYQDMQPILEHNYQLIIKKLFTKDITYVS